MDIACSHCDAPVPACGAARYRGRVYHPHCRKCFVCDEVDLQDAESFQGVIFCGACARRIFAERARRRPRAPASPRARPPRRTHRTRLRDLHTQTVFYANPIPASVDVLSLDKILAQDAADTRTDSSENMTPVPQHLVQVPDRYNKLDTGDVPALPDLTTRRASTEHKSTAADVGLAELGASVELAQVALRPPSVTLVIKSGSAFELEENKSLSHEFKPGTSMSPAASSLSRSPWKRRSFWRNKRFSSVLKIPFMLLKRNILDRSSFISVYDRTERPGTSPRRLRDLFHDEISRHHRRGERVLYNTINRGSPPYKLGWVHAGTGRNKDKRCRHYGASHSYRCLRAHVMKRAGPTRSELQQVRGSIRRLVTGQFVGRLLREANLTTVRAG